MIGGSSSSDGYLLFDVGNGMWSSICPCGFGIWEATIACKELCGNLAYGSVLRGRLNYGAGVADLSTYPYKVLRMNCSEDSHRLMDCDRILAFNETEQSLCGSKQGVGIRCYEHDGAATAKPSDVAYRMDHESEC